MSHRVLIVRELDLCGSLPSLLRSRGFDIVAVPVTAIEFEFPTAEALLIREDQWVAFSSANGVRGLHAALQNISRDFPKTTRIATVGKATALAVEEYLGREVDLIASFSDGEHFARDLVSILPTTSTVYYPCAGGAESDFERVCKAGGLDVDAVVVYRTLALSTALLEQSLRDAVPFEAAVFYAPSAVRAFGAAWKGRWEFAAIAIGPATERALKQVGAQHILTSKNPQPPSIADAVLEVCLTHAEHDHE